MKITKINGLGSFGVYVDDFDYTSVEAWKELEQINLKYLVTVVRGNGQDYWNDIAFGAPFAYRARALPGTKLIEKYGRNWQNPAAYDAEDLLAHEHRPYMQIDEVGKGFWTRISGERNEQGKVRGMFADTELLWHSNGSGDSCFSPLVLLYGKRGMLGSSTGFVVSADWLDEQTESFRSELENMVAVHEWKPHAIEPTGSDEHEALLKSNFADWKPSEMPLIMTSPGGIRGVHLGEGTIQRIKGMSEAESAKLIDHLRSELICEKWSMQVWWPNDQGDLYLFDNSITLHNRTFEPGTDISAALQRRLGYRTSGDYRSRLDWEPSTLEPWRSNREQRLKLHYHLANMFDAGNLSNIMNRAAEARIQNYEQQLIDNIDGLAHNLEWFRSTTQQQRWQEIFDKFNIQ